MEHKKRKSRLSNSAAEARTPEREVPLWASNILTTLMQVNEEDPARRIFVRRAIEEIIQISRDLPIEAIEETAVLSSGKLLLLRTLQTPGLLAELEQYEPLASPYLKGMTAQQDLLREAGGLMTGSEVAEMLDISRQAVDKRRTSRKLIAIPRQRSFGYPTCQFTAKGPVQGLEDVLQTLGGSDGWSQLVFVLSANSVLHGQTPIAALNDGHLHEVLQAAALFGEHGAL